MIRVKHAPSAAAIGGTAYTVGRGEKRRWAAGYGLKQQALGLQAASIGASAQARAGQLALQKERQDFVKEQWQEEPARQLERGLQQQKLLQSKISWQYDEGQKREMAKVTTGVAWLRNQVSAGKWTAEQAEQAEQQLWRKYHSIIPLPVYDDKATPQERYDGTTVTDKITGAQYRENERGGFDPVGIDFKDYAKLRSDVAKAFTSQITDPESKDFGMETTDWAAVDKFVDETMVRFTKIQGFAARAEAEAKRRAERGPQPSLEQEAQRKAAVEALPVMFDTIIKGQPKIGRKKKAKPSLFADDVYGEEAYNKVLVEAVGRGERDGIPPDVVKAELDKWWDAQHDKYRGKRLQKFGNRMEFKPTPAPAAAAAREISPAKRQKAIDYVKSVLQQGVYASLDKKTRSDIGVKMLAEIGIQVTPDELAADKVKMKAPNGEIYEVDRTEVKEAEKHGWVTF